MFKDKINALIAKQNSKPSKKKIENIVVFIVILIITVIAINTIWNGDKKEKTVEKSNSNTDKKLVIQEETVEVDSANTQDTIEKRLEDILSNIDGVGKVKVLITYSESSEVVAMYNENSKNSQIEEKDSGGGTRTTTQTDTAKDIIYKEENGEKVPVTKKIVNPKIEGAIITSTGARKC